MSKDEFVLMSVNLIINNKNISLLSHYLINNTFFSPAKKMSFCELMFARNNDESGRVMNWGVWQITEIIELLFQCGYELLNSITI